MRNFLQFTRIGVAVVLLLATLLPSFAQTTRRVTTMGAATGTNGSNWTDQAMSLQAALAASNATGDQIWIAQGTYRPHADERIATFSVSAGVLVYGGFAGTEAALADRAGGATILSGDLLGDDGDDPTAPGYVATRDDNSNTVVYIFGADVTLDGLTITAGDGGEFGGGLAAEILATGTVVRNCKFTNNSTRLRGGGASFETAATLTNCVFENNSTTGRGAVPTGGGGAYFLVAGTLTNCVFAGNTSAYNGGGLFLAYGAAAVLNTTFYNNTAGTRGGGIYVSYRGDGDFPLLNSILVGNTATDAASGNQAFVNNTDLARNMAVISNNLIAGNSIRYQSPGGLGASILQRNTKDETDPTVIFASTEASNANYLRLVAGSPAVGAGNNDYVNTPPPVTTDAAGAARIQRNVVDLGAYESDLLTPQTITFTSDAAGTVGGAITLAARATSRLPVSFAIESQTLTSGTGDVATLDAGVLTLVGEGTVVITATQDGDVNYAPAMDVMQTITVMPVLNIRRVTTAGDAGNDGSSWAEAMTLREALAASTTVGNQIWIAAGTYTPHATNRTETFNIPEGVLVYGGFVGDEAEGFDPATTARMGGATILSGDLAGDDMFGVRNENSITVVTVEGAGVTLDGLTIKGGSRGVAIVGAGGAAFYGAGLYSNFANTSLNACTFTDNVAITAGGGAYFGENAVLTNCVFASNTAPDGAGVSLNSGGTVINSTFYGNTAANGGGGISVAFDTNNPFTLQNSLLLDNTAADVASGHQVFVNNADAANVANIQHNLIEGEGAGAGVSYQDAASVNIARVGTVTEGEAAVVFASTDATHANYLRLKEFSPAVGAGNNTYIPAGISTDAVGEMRIQAVTVDLGAYESAFDAPTAQAITFADPTGGAVVRVGQSIDLVATTDAPDGAMLDIAFASSATDVAVVENDGDGTFSLRFDDAGTVTITATQVGGVGTDGVTYAAATARQTIMVEAILPTAQAITFTTPADGVTRTVGDDIALEATTDAMGLFVSFEIDNPAVATLTDDGVGDGIGTLRLLTAGTVMVTARQAGGDGTGGVTYSAATSVTHTITVEAVPVAPTAQAITFTTPADGVSGAVGDDIALEAMTDAMGLFVSFEINPATGIATLTDVGDGTGTLRLLTAGTVMVTATQAGGDGTGGVTYLAATSVTHTITVRRPAIFRVTTAGNAGNDGLSWTNAMTLQAALAEATLVGDQIWIAQGTYLPDAANRDATFTIPKGVLVYGGFDPVADATDTDASSRAGAATILSGDLANNDIARPLVGADLAAYNASRTDNSFSIVRVAGAGVTLDGLTITGGVRGVESNVGIIGFTSNHLGAGLYAGDGATGTVVSNCNFINNSLAVPGLMAFGEAAAGGGAFFAEDATLTNCTFTGNSSNAGVGFGGGVAFAQRATANLTDCAFTANTGGNLGGGAYFGRGVTVLMNCVFTDNSGDIAGGASFAGIGTLANCIFTGNEATYGGGARFQSGGTITNTTFYNNTAGERGGGIAVDYDGNRDNVFNLANSILVGNTATISGNALFFSDLGVPLNAADIIAVIDHNLIGGGEADLSIALYDDNDDSYTEVLLAAARNLTFTNPIEESDAAVVFASTDESNANYLRLAAGSPAVGAGNNNYVNNARPPIRTDAVGAVRVQRNVVDLGAYESDLLRPQTITFTSDDAGTTGGTITLAATATSSLPVSFAIESQTLTSGTGDVATLDAGVLTLISAGTVVITATQDGDVNYAPAMEVMQTITVMVAPTIRRVTTAGNAVNDGSTWANAMSLQAALAVAIEAGDQIWIAAGTYKPVEPASAISTSEEREATFTIPAGVLVYGGFEGDEASFTPDNPGTSTNEDTRDQNAEGALMHVTILSGDLADNDLTDRKNANYTLFRNDNSYSVVTVGSADVTLDGLTIEGGEHGAEVRDLFGISRYGAGLYAGAGTAGITLTTCTFNNNSADDNGGGAYFAESATLTNCVFDNNNADYGGGAYFFGTATVTSCTFTGNTVINNFSSGGGAYFSGTATVMSCTFTGNTARGIFSSGGGAIFLGIATVTNGIFTGNEATSGGGGVTFREAATVINSTLYNNMTDRQGGGLYVSGFPFTLQNSIFVSNTAVNAASGHQLYVENTDAADEVNVQYNLIAGGSEGAGLVYFDASSANVTEVGTIDQSDATAVFASIMANEDDYLRLAAGSLAVNAGNDDYLNNGTPDDTGDDIMTDAEGNARIQGRRVDLGAYESAFDPPAMQRITFASPAVGGVVGNTINLTATTNAPGLFVTFSIDPPNGIATLLDDGTGDGMGMLRLDAVGVVTVTAVQAGGDAGGITYPQATSVTHTITVRSAGTAIFRAAETATGTGDGNSWADAMTLQEALGTAIVAGDQVWIAAGTYTPDADDRTATFNISAGVLVYGGFDPVVDAADTDASSRSGGATILSGDLADNDLTDRKDADYTLRRTENSYSVVTIGGANATLDGLTIEGGERGATVGTNHYGAGLYARAGTTGITLTACTFNNNNADDSGGGAYFTEGAMLTDCTFNNSSADDDGGGAFFNGTTAILTNCVFADNNAIDNGGGAYFNATSTLTNCTFNNNSVDDSGGGAFFFGVPTLMNCVFADNNATDDGAGAYFDGAATVTGCDFNDNDSEYWGGGALFRGIATVTNCTFTANTANGIFSSGGGAIFFETATVTQCIFTNNETTNDGGGAAFREGGMVINSTLYNNTAHNQGGGIFVRFETNNPFTLQNSILVGNTATDAMSGHQVYVNNEDVTDEVNVQYNLIAGGATGEGAGLVYFDATSYERYGGWHGG